MGLPDLPARLDLGERLAQLVLPVPLERLVLVVLLALRVPLALRVWALRVPLALLG